MLTTFARNLRLLLRGFGLLLVVLWGVVLTLLLLPLRPFGPRVRDTLLQWVARHWFRLLQRVMGVRERIVGKAAPGPVLIASNHISWLDIVVLGSHIGTCFVSKSEVASWPVVGWLARQGGTLFIHRGLHDSAARIAHDMTERLSQGNRLLFFPEGTTSDGSDVRRFKNRLFQPALEIDAPVQPVAIRYLKGDEAVDPVAYLPGITLIASVRGVLARRHTDVEVDWCEPVAVQGRERRDVAAEAEQRVRVALQSVPDGE